MKKRLVEGVFQRCSMLWDLLQEVRTGKPKKCPIIFCLIKGFVWPCAAKDRVSSVSDLMDSA